MNRAYHSQKGLQVNFKNGEACTLVFLSFRLIRLMAKKLNIGEWDFIYFKIDSFYIGSGFSAELISLNGELIALKEQTVL